MSELIIITDIYSSSKIEPSFVHLLESEGLIEIQIIEGKQYIEESKLNDLERFARWHYDLSINIEGIDVIHNLLDRMNDMEKQLNSLKTFLDNKNDTYLEE